MSKHVTQVEKDEGPRSFAVFLTQIADGDLDRELSAKLHEVGLALDTEVENVGKAKGEISLTIKFDADRKNVVVSYDAKIKKPAPPRPGTTMWLTPGSNFSPENPRQGKLPLRDVAEVPAREGKAL